MLIEIHLLKKKKKKNLNKNVNPKAIYKRSYKNKARVLSIFISNSSYSFLVMSQLHAAAKKQVSLYYPVPKSTYEKFINKKWIERKNVFQSKKNFIENSNSVWKTTSQRERDEFMNAPAPIPKHQISHFFKPNKISVADTCESSNSATEILSISHEPAIPPSILTVNASTAMSDRLSFLDDKEMNMIKKAMFEIGVSDSNKFFSGDIKNDEKFMCCLKQFAYEWDKFSMLKKQYGGGKTKNRTSNLSRNLENISQEVGTLKTLFDEVYSYNITVSMSAFALSQTYLKKSESVTKLITTMGRLKDMVSESDLLIALRR